jgi:PAS domain S-box-containing protein
MSELINLLIVEDSEYDAILLAHELRKTGIELNMERVQTAKEMQAALAAKNWDAVISDYNLPAFSAPKALEVLRQSGKDLPFVVVSGAIGEETAVEIMRSGAHDYLMKGNLNRLAEVLRREIRDARGRVESRRAEIALKVSEKQLRLLFERSNDAIFIVEKQTGRYLDANKAAEKITGRTVHELKTFTVADITPQEAQDRLEQVSTVDNLLDFNAVTYMRPDGTTRTAQLTTLPIDEMRVFGIAHDITEQIQAENALKQRAQELEVLYHTALEINSQTDLLPLLRTIVERAASLLNAHMGGLYLIRPEDNQTLELVVSHNLPRGFLGTTLHLGEGLSGLIAKTGQVIMVDDYRTWQNRAAIYETSPFRRVLGVPMRVKGQVIGVINITDDEITGPYFSRRNPPGKLVCRPGSHCGGKRSPVKRRSA